MRLLVCGGRDYADQARFDFCMAQVDQRYRITVIIQGNARGADRMAKLWAVHNGRELDGPDGGYTADWDGLGARAGSVRNRRMAVEGKPDLVLAFPGGPGTRNMMGIAREMGIKVWEA